MGKIGDLWVRLGLKKEGFDKGIDEAKNKTTGFGDSLKSMKALGIMLWTEIGKKALEAADSFAHTSQRFGDAWDSTTSQMKAAWQTFTSALTSMDWEGLGQRIKNAMMTAKKGFQASDAEVEIENSISRRKSAMQEELANLQLIMRSQKYSDKEREQAATKYLSLVKPIYDAESKMRNESATAKSNTYLATLGIATDQSHRDALNTALTDVLPNQALTNALRQYNARNNGKKYKLTSADQAMVDDFIKQHEGNWAAVLTIVDKYQSTNDKKTKEVVDALNARDASKGAYAEETRRIQTIRDSMSVSASTPRQHTETADERKAREIKEQAAALRAAFVPLEEIKNPLDGLSQAMQQNAADISESLKKVATAYSQQDFLDRHGWKGSMEEYVDWLNEMAQVTDQASQQVRSAIVGGFSDSLSTLADGLTGVEQINASDAFGALVKPIAQACTQIGEMVMMEGLAMISFKDSINNPYVALAAGAALIAVGQLATSGIEKAIGNVGGSASSTSGTSSGTSSDYNGELTIHVQGEIKGDTIAISGQKAINKWNR